MALTIVIGGPESEEKKPVSEDAVRSGIDVEGAPIDPAAGIPASPDLTFMQGFGVEKDTGFSEWVKSVGDESYLLKAGGVLAEQQIKAQNPDLYNTNRSAELYEKWQPQIWDAEDELNMQFDKKSDSYQSAFERLGALKKSYALDQKGEYFGEPETPIDWSKVLNFAADNKAYMLGAMAKGIVADPELLLIPGGWTKMGFIAARAAKALEVGAKTVKAAELAGKILGGGGVAASLGAAAEITDQLTNAPDTPINTEAVMKTAALFSVMGAALPPLMAATGAVVKGTARAVSKQVGEFYSAAKIDQIKREAQIIFGEAEGKLTQAQAIEKAVAKHHPYESERINAAKLTEEAGTFLDDTSVAIAFNQITAAEAFGAMVKRVALETAEDTIRGWNKMVQPVITSIRKLGMLGVATQLLRHDRLEMKKLSDRLMIKDAYSKARKTVSKSQQDLLKIHVLNGTLNDISEQFDPKVIKAYQDVRKMLEEMRAEMIENGMLTKKKVDGDIDEDRLPGVEDFWPRDIDFKAYAASKGVDVKVQFDLYAKAINDKYNLTGKNRFEARHLTAEIVNDWLSPEEIAFVLADKVAGKITPKTSLATNTLKKRTVELVAPADLQFYAPEHVSLTNYILRMTPKIEARNFFGGAALKERALLAADIPSADPAQADTLIKGFVEDYTNGLLKRGEILEEKIPELAGLLEARFAGGFKRPNKYIQGSKNLMYAMLLGNPFAASIQLGDLGSSAYVNGVINTMTNVQKVVLRKNKITMDSVGLQAMAHEAEHQGWTARVNEFALKYGTFKAVDALGKETIMNASLSKNLKAVKQVTKLRKNGPSDELTKAEAKAIAHFRKEYGTKVDDETVNAMMEGFIKGDITDPDLLLAVFSDLTKVQPVTLSEMPVLYLNHPNGRILYMLKTFTLKQIDLARTTIIDEMVKESKGASAAGKTKASAKAMVKTAHLLGTIGLANAGVDTARRFLTNEDFELTDAMFASVLRTWGYNDYAMNLLRQGKVELAIASMVAPPVGVLIEPIADLAQGDLVGFLLNMPILRAAKKFAEQDDDKSLPYYNDSTYGDSYYSEDTYK